MKTRHVPNSVQAASAMTSTTASYRAKRRSRSEDESQETCEREMRHEAHVRERQEEVKRTRAATAAALRSRQQQHHQLQQLSARNSQRWPMVDPTPRGTKSERSPVLVPEKPASKPKPAATKSKPKAKEKPLKAVKECGESPPREQQTEKDPLWREELLIDDPRISEADMRRIIKEQQQQEQEQSLGHQMQPADSQLAVALHSLVAEFLHAENYQLAFSVFCNENPQRRGDGDPEARHSEFRFSQSDLQDVLGAVLAGWGDTTEKLSAAVQRSYYQEQDQSLLRALLRVLMNAKQQQQLQLKIKGPPKEDMDAAEEARSVLIGPRLCESIHSMKQRLREVMRHMIPLSIACAPPVDVVSEEDLEDLLLLELEERDRLIEDGHKLEPAETALLLPDLHPRNQMTAQQEADNLMVAAAAEQIEKPVMHVNMPQMPQLFAQQIGYMATIRQSVERMLRSEKQPQPNNLFASFEQMDQLVSELCVNVSLLVNMVNMAMEQEHAVGRNAGFKLGYHEGFSHGHFLAAQEAAKLPLKEQLEQKPEERPTQTIPCRDVAVQAKAIRSKHVSTQTAKLPLKEQLEQQPEERPTQTMPSRDVAVQAKAIRSKNVSTQTKKKKVQLHVPEEELQVDVPMVKRVEEVPKEQQWEMATQTIMAQVPVAVAATQTKKILKTETSGPVAVAATQTSKSQEDVNTATQTLKEDQEKVQVARGTQTKASPCKRTYEDWIEEMLRSGSGKLFLKRVEMSLKKASDLQKQQLEDLYQVKMKHQAEMMQLSQRQSSWRTLCRHMDSDTSVEARDLVHKIFNLLEHYEAHQQLLTEQMEATELAAQKAVRFVPVFNDNNGTDIPICTSAASTPPTSSRSKPTSVAAAAASPLETPRSAQQQQMVPAAPTIVVAPASHRPNVHTVATNTPRDTSSPPQQTTSPYPASPNPSTQPVSSQPASSRPASWRRATASPHPASPHRESSYPASSRAASSYRAPSQRASPQAAASSFTSQAAPAPAAAAASFENALASAKSRMEQLEEESERLEQNFLDYLERSRQTLPEQQLPPPPSASKKKKKSSRRRFEDASTLFEIEELNEQQQQTLTKNDNEVEPEPAPEPDTYQFINTLNVARKKLLGEPCQPAKEPTKGLSRELAQVQEQTQQILYRMRTEHSQSTTHDHLLPEITSESNSSSSSDELEVLMRRAMHAMKLNEEQSALSNFQLLDYNTSSTLASGRSSRHSAVSEMFQPKTAASRQPTDKDAATSPSVRLQRSMAKMQELFAGAGILAPEHRVPLPLPLPRSTTDPTRPVSAPSPGGKTRAAGGGKSRPHTAPTTQQKKQKQNQQQQQQYFPSTIEDCFNVSSSVDSSSYGGLVLDHLFDNTTANRQLPASPEILHSRNFWKRLNL
ncbi:uncharacterized protein LOC117581278 [Drosophila guanche]|uniref:LisH domain-containing protein n=1 Tax=Drosophila guanche TaxID=7266 RepID=A0A3B0JZB0_DROGU|nr:uncharacterized protein LOC117581278 [Drosophila guanche]XP_034124191.1 uncharacterized protein LOC117581278 [Drosophila guanche]SPP78061.1 Hypothetical predicted protein [Drosophila guanche]